MVPDTQPWWSSIQEANALLDSFGEGFDKWPARLQKKAALAVNPDHATQLVDWAGWREHYMPGASNM
jgi:hypothetical protein